MPKRTSKPWWHAHLPSFMFLSVSTATLLLSTLRPADLQSLSHRSFAVAIRQPTTHNYRSTATHPATKRPPKYPVFRPFSVYPTYKVTFSTAYVTMLYRLILSVLDPRKCEYLRDYSLYFEHACMTTYLAS
jgi:hypothetical protein